jgi:hypothetical protein
MNPGIEATGRAVAPLIGCAARAAMSAHDHPKTVATLTKPLSSTHGATLTAIANVFVADQQYEFEFRHRAARFTVLLRLGCGFAACSWPSGKSSARTIPVILRCDSRDTAPFPGLRVWLMSLGRAVFGTLATVGCCLLPLLGQPGYANTEPPRSTHHKPATTASAPVQVPFFQPGLWEYRRTVMKDGSPSPQVSMLRKCADPSTEIRDKMAELGKRSCRSAPLTHRLHRYISSWICPTPLGPTRFRAVLIVRGTVGYTDLSEMRTTEHITRQRVEAARVGECTANGPDKQFRPNPQADYSSS